ncbi:MAG: phosphoglyceromutase [Rhodothermales bacterium]|nr:phosphoglyceromutase [Rhodothermales bacterium]
MNYPIIPALALVCALTVPAQAQESANVFLITLDGLRWEELFTGADEWLLGSDFTSDEPGLRTDFWHDDPMERRRLLMPFFWSTIAEEGQLHGHRTLGSEADVTNTRVFSYPGYNEILTGFADPSIDSNDKIPNHNVTVLEWLNRQPEFEGRVAAFGSWDVFPYIINEERSGVSVNAGFEPAEPPVSERERFLNELQAQIPSPWGTVRLDAFTHHFAFEHLKRERPRVLYIAYGETDDFAHDGDYDAYLRAAHRTDAFIRDLWEWVQNDSEYAGRTTFLITTDHGRGAREAWIGHGGNDDWAGSEHIWVAAIGPVTPPTGEATTGSTGQNQIAATVAAVLGLDYDAGGRAGRPIQAIIE